MAEPVVAIRGVVGGAPEVAAHLDDASRRARGHSSLGEVVQRDLARPGPDSFGFVATSAERPVAYAHVARDDSSLTSPWSVGLVVRPGLDDGVRVGTAVLLAAVDHARDRGGGSVVLWRFGPTPEDDRAAAAAGLTPTRELLQMRAPLPPRETPRWPGHVTVRTFRPGEDEAAWLAVNNAAFADHPEQGGWTASTLQRRMAEGWFDADLFLLAIDVEGLAGFNWLKVHASDDVDPALGEIFVIAVDPRSQGTGLGRALAVAGLDRLAARGLDTAMLYVAEENDRARRLYEHLGFAVHRRDRAYARTLVPAGPS